MRFPVTIDRDEDGVWIVECPSIPGCVSQGGTKDEAIANIHDAIKLCLEVRSERGLPLNMESGQSYPIWSPDQAFSAADVLLQKLEIDKGRE